MRSSVSHLLAPALLATTFAITSREASAQPDIPPRQTEAQIRAMIPFRVEVVPLETDKPGALRFRVDFVSLHPQKAVSIRVLDSERPAPDLPPPARANSRLSSTVPSSLPPFRFRILDENGKMLNAADFVRVPKLAEQLRKDKKRAPHVDLRRYDTSSLFLIPDRLQSYELTYPGDDSPLKPGRYKVQALVGIEEFAVNGEPTKLDAAQLVQSGEVEITVKTAEGGE